MYMGIATLPQIMTVRILLKGKILYGLIIFVRKLQMKRPYCPSADFETLECNCFRFGFSKHCFGLKS